MMKQQQINDREVPPRPTGILPRYFTEEYSGMETDIAEDVFAAIYWKLRDKADQNVDKNKPIDWKKDIAAQMQLIADAMSEAGVQTNVLQSAAERASAQIIALIQKNGFFRMVRQEYSSIEEWLADLIPQLPVGSSGLSNAKFLYEIFLPIVDELGNGFTSEKLMTMKENWSKVQAAIPFLRQHTKELEEVNSSYEKNIKSTEITIDKLSHKADIAVGKEQDEIRKQLSLVKIAQKKLDEQHDKAMAVTTKRFKAALSKTLQVIADPRIPAWGPNSVKHVLVTDNHLTIYEGEKCYLKDGTIVFQVALPKDYERTLESMLKQLCQFSMTDGKIMVSTLGKMVLANEGKGRSTNKKPIKKRR